MLLATSQPYFAPYPGFFYKINMADCFVILDDVQFPRKTTWISRNRFKNDQGALWMTIPVWKKGRGLQKISQVRICHAGSWNKKHLRSFKSAYAHAPFLSENVGMLERVFSMQFDRLLDLNLEMMHYILSQLKIETRIVRMSELKVRGKGASLIIDICKTLGATRYLVQSSALSYYDPARFASEGLALAPFKKPDYIYPQLWGDFIANLSILDMMFNCGPKTRDIVRV